MGNLVLISPPCGFNAVKFENHCSWLYLSDGREMLKEKELGGDTNNKQSCPKGKKKWNFPKVEIQNQASKEASDLLRL